MPLTVVITFLVIAGASAGLMLAVRSMFAPADGDGQADDAPVLRLMPRVDEEEDDLIGRLDDRFIRLVQGAGIDLAPISIVLIQVLCGIMLGGLVFLGSDNVTASLTAAALAMLLPILFLMVRKSQREQQLWEQLPEVIDLLARAVRSGMSLEQAVSVVGRDMPAPWGTEFARCARQIEVGLSVSAAFNGLSRRVGLVELRTLATVLSVYRKSGGNLPVILERQAALVRERMGFRRQFRAQTAGARLSTLMIMIAAPLGFIALLFMQQSYASYFFRDATGFALFCTALALQLVGVLWIRRLLKVNY